MDLFEHQAVTLFRKNGVPTSPGMIARTPLAAKEIAQEMGTPVVVKAQVKVGGRGKAGGVKLAKTPDEAEARAQEILGLDIKGHIVSKVLVAQATSIKEEYYISFMIDRANRNVLAMCSVEGGMEIEKVAAEHPDALATKGIDPVKGVSLADARALAQAGGLPEDILDTAADAIMKLYNVFVNEDATLVEVNPLVRTEDDRILAIDGKVTLDDNAEFRHPHTFEDFADAGTTDPLEIEAKKFGLNYVKLDGDVGIIGNGAGLVMSTLDVVAYAGERHDGVKPANFLDIGGGASAEVMAAGLGIVLADEQVTAVFINVFGGITACDQVARGIVAALHMLGDNARKPLVVRLDGNKVEEGREILVKAQHPLITIAETMDDGAELVALLAQQALSQSTQTTH